ncbi:MAG: MFS transporter, partial [Nanoarchaeota archaeon]
MENEQKLKEAAKRNSIRDGSFYSIMDGMGMRYITPYALSMGISNRLIGILEVFPALIGNILRILFNKSYYKKSRKGIVLPFVFIQAFFWIPLLLVGFAYFFLSLSLFYSSLFLVISYSMIIISGLIASPAWVSWMQDLVESNRGAYFGRRNKINGLVLVISMLTAGLILDYFEKGQIFFGFAILFILASLGRYISFYFLKKQYEPKVSHDEKSYFSFFQFIKKMPSNNFGRFVIFVSLTSFAVTIASPFFSVYMLKELKLSYLAFTIINLGVLISPIIFLSFIGKLSDKIGTVKVMKISGFLISFVPLLWIFSIFLIKSSPLILITYLFVIELFSGFVWAAYNIASSNFIYDAVTKQKIILCFTYFGFINSIGAFFGGFIGGQISSISSFSLFGLGSILSVFLISFVLRLIPSLFIAPKLKEVREVDGSRITISFGIQEKFDSFWRFITFS